MSTNDRINKAYKARLRHVSTTIGHADLTEAVNGTAQLITLAVLPAGAYIIDRQINIATLFSGGSVSAVGVTIGGTDDDAIVGVLDVFTGATTGDVRGTDGVRPVGAFSGQTIKAKFTPDGGHALLALTAGAMTIDLIYAVAE